MCKPGKSKLRSRSAESLAQLIRVLQMVSQYHFVSPGATNAPTCAQRAWRVTVEEKGPRGQCTDLPERAQRINQWICTADLVTASEVTRDSANGNLSKLLWCRRIRGG
jgi:hypothetical protein